MARADVMSLIGVPGDPTAQMSADIRECSSFRLAHADDEQATVGCSPFPTIDAGAREVEAGWETKGILFQSAPNR